MSKPKSVYNNVARCVPIIAVLVLLALSGSALAQNGAADGEWHHYGGDAGSTRYSPLDQITPANSLAIIRCSKCTIPDY